MWQLNMETEVQITNLRGSKIYTIDNVFEEPNKLKRYLFNRRTALLQGTPWVENGEEYFKGRYTDFEDKACPIIWLASNLCSQPPSYHGGFMTNVESWRKSEYNDYKNNYWFPHLDNGYTCIVYFNEGSGTNLYDPSTKEEDWFKQSMKDKPDVINPWVKRSKIKVIKKLKSKYNRMVLFDGNKFPHSSTVDDAKYFEDNVTDTALLNKRCNLCFFLAPNEKK